MTVVVWHHDDSNAPVVDEAPEGGPVTNVCGTNKKWLTILKTFDGVDGQLLTPISPDVAGG